MRPAALLLPLILGVLTPAHAAFVEIVRGDGLVVVSDASGGRTELSAAKPEQTVALASGEVWKGTYGPQADTVTIQAVKGTLDILLSCCVRVTIPEGARVVLRLDGNGRLTALEFPGDSPGKVLVTLDGAVSLALEPGAALRFRFLADGTLRVELTAGKALFTDARGNARWVAPGFIYTTPCARPLPHWRIGRPAEERPVSPGSP